MQRVEGVGEEMLAGWSHRHFGQMRWGDNPRRRKGVEIGRGGRERLETHRERECGWHIGLERVEEEDVFYK